MRLIFAFMLALLPSGAFACGPDTDCQVGDRIYRIAMPDGVQNPGVLVFSHGYRGSARGVMRNGGLRRLANEMNLALIAVQGQGGTWDLSGSPSNPQSDGSAEFAYFENVLNDAQTRFWIDRTDVVATGFSAGGMMTWNLICHRSDLLRGAVPMSGTFWENMPTSCDTTPVSVVHIHGDKDPTVPLSGRPIRTTHQGDVSKAIGMYARHGGFGNEVAQQTGGLTCATRENTEDQVLALCMFSGGHSFRLENLRAGLEMLK
jgi:polyhydroxybutyrate depolymerase